MDRDPIYVVSRRLVVYRNTAFGIDAWDRIDRPARYLGRFHRKGEPLPLYAAGSAVAALGESELHTDELFARDREILRRITAFSIAAGTRILIGDHLATLGKAGLTLERLYHPTDYSGCHQLIDFARSIPGIAAVSTQSNADRRQRAIVVLPEYVHRITALVDYWEGSLNLLKQAFASDGATSGQR